MFKRGPIPPLAHGLLDYLLAALLIAAPFVIGFDADAATALSIAAGVAFLLLGAFTAWTTGIARSVPPVAHAMLDYALAVLLIALPFLAGFTDDGGGVGVLRGRRHRGPARSPSRRATCRQGRMWSTYPPSTRSAPPVVADARSELR